MTRGRMEIILESYDLRLRALHQIYEQTLLFALLRRSSPFFAVLRRTLPHLSAAVLGRYLPLFAVLRRWSPLVATYCLMNLHIGRKKRRSSRPDWPTGLTGRRRCVSPAVVGPLHRPGSGLQTSACQSSRLDGTGPSDRLASGRNSAFRPAGIRPSDRPASSPQSSRHPAFRMAGVQPSDRLASGLQTV